MNPTTLVVYYHRYTYPMRRSVEDHLYSLGRYGETQCAYVNAGFGIPCSVLKRRWDLVLFHTTFIAQLRWNDQPYNSLIRRSACLKKLGGVIAALPQDEFLHSDNVSRFINEFGVSHVFSCADREECKKIYRDVDFAKVHFHQVLTGYLDERTLHQIRQLEEGVKCRDVDIGYRAFKAPPWLGRHGLLKVAVAEKFKRAVEEGDLKCDISTEEKDTFLGLGWYRFMLRCKYMIGVEGGSSVLDYDGSIRRCVDRFIVAHPQSAFEVVKAACFPEKDGGLNLKAISPRHLEACATKTCQVLVEGAYSGVLQPWQHYIPVKADFSNMEQVLQVLKDDKMRTTLVDRAYQDVVLSGRWTYQGFVKQILDTCLPGREEGVAPRRSGFKRLWVREKACWLFLAVEAKIWSMVKRCMPSIIVRFIRGFRRNL